MRPSVFLVVFLVACLGVSGSGIGLSPQSVSLYSGEKKTVFVSNPNDFDMKVQLSSDCDDLYLGEQTILLPGHSMRNTVIEAKQNTRGCEGSLTATILENSSQGIGLSPGVTIPLSVSSSARSVRVAAVFSVPGPSKLIGLSIVFSIVCLGLLGYLALNKIRFPKNEE